mmetsp:Transcript_87023/g.145198  ORF Transcript_87023/g.145198 Transcript_87023/m.145198 type:complete len:145 (+) Transcript_87023:2-436(+)
MDLPSQDMVGKPCAIKDIDLNVATVDDYRTISVPFSCPINLDSQVSGFAGWFSTTFEGSQSAPAKQPHVVLNTAPGTGYTHWGQQVFNFYPTIYVMRGDVASGTVEVTRRKDNQRLLNVKISYVIRRPGDGDGPTPEVGVWQIQ